MPLQGQETNIFLKVLVPGLSEGEPPGLSKLYICCGKCGVQLQAHSSASPQGSEIDRKPLEVQKFKYRERKYSYLPVGT